MFTSQLRQHKQGSVRSRYSSTICQTFDRQANESGLYDVDSSWPTEYWVVKKEIAQDSNEQRVKVSGRDNFTDVRMPACVFSQDYIELSRQ
ncbi:hypothetical protein T06_11502 [Trichinella sp. T6]|nr:hypothetical protein T06_11502 [Trichinella sp. T6]